MRLRRHSPYSHIETLRHSRQELLTLALLTAGLGILLSLLADLLGATLANWLPWVIGRYLLVGGLSVVLTGLVVALFYARSESRWVPMEIQIPYHLPADSRPRIARRGSYGVTIHARRAFMRRYAQDSPALQEWLDEWRRAKEKGIPFQHFIAEDNAALLQCLVTYVLHRHGDASLGPRAAYGWREADLPARQLAMADLPSELGDNPFLRVDQRPEEWRLWWPTDVEIELVRDENEENPFPRWRLKHRRYGHVEIRWHPHLSVAGRDSQVWHILTHHLKLDHRSDVFIIGTRLEARVCFRWTFWPGDDAFHDWTIGLLAYLEEALDWGYYLNTRTDRLVAIQDQRMGWVPAGTSVFDKLQEIEGRLEQLEVTLTKESSSTEIPVDLEEELPAGEALVV